MYSIKNIMSYIKILQMLYFNCLSKWYLEEAVTALKEHDDKAYFEYTELYTIYKHKSKAIYS